MISAISVKDRLKRQAIEDGKTLQDKLVSYGLERTIYRLSVSQYVEKFTLKGGIFLYALFGGEYARATTDIDLLAQHVPNDLEKMRNVFNDIFSIECDDAIRFDLATLEVIRITEFKEYPGVKVSIIGYLDKTRIPISIDIGFGDVVYPERMKMEFPVLLNMEVPEIYAYSIYSVIAETFSHRGTGFDDIVAFSKDFTEDAIRQARWQAFVKKKRALVKVDFKETMQLLENLLVPVTEAIKNNVAFEFRWDKESKSWEREERYM